MVEFVDGSTIAQCSPPDMRLPIALGLAWPERIPDAAPACDWTTGQRVDLRAARLEECSARSNWPAAAGRPAAPAPAVYNAANEECVDAFCAGIIGFLDIVETIEAVVDEHLSTTADLADAVPGESFIGRTT